MGPALAAGIGGGIDLAGGLLANAASAHQAHLNRRFVKNMSNTAHQREVADLKAAGLNPALAYGMGGASTPGGSSAPQENVGSDAVNGATSAASSAMNAMANKVSILKMGAEIKKTSAEAEFLTKSMENRLGNVKEKGYNLAQSTRQMNAAADYTNVQREYFSATAEDRKAMVKAELEGQRRSNQLQGFMVPGASARALKDSTFVGKYIMPWIADALGLFRALSPGGIPSGVPPTVQKDRIGF